MASGKSSIGRQVAELLNVGFIDTDATVSQRHGTIADIFAQHGEEYFRALEEDAVREAVVDHPRSVIALGGGAILSESTRSLLGACTVILLMTDEETVLARANLDKRPLLKHDPSAWSRILAERLPLYLEVATVTFNSGVKPKEQTAADIVAWLGTEESK